MENYYWKTDYPHSTNTETMNEYLDEINMLDITLHDGSYAEGKNAKGDRYALHASGAGDSFNHTIRFEKLN